jgi:hypothetical protein
VLIQIRHIIRGLFSVCFPGSAVNYLIVNGL